MMSCWWFFVSLVSLAAKGLVAFASTTSTGRGSKTARSEASECSQILEISVQASEPYEGLRCSQICRMLALQLSKRLGVPFHRLHMATPPVQLICWSCLLRWTERLR